MNSPNSGERDGEASTPRAAPDEREDRAEEAGGAPPGDPLVEGGAGANDEFVAIARLRARFEAAARSLDPNRPPPPAGDVWIGDDAAVVTLGDGGRGVWATDLVVDGVHVDLDLGGLSDMGFKALMVAASDLAAMGARPEFALVSIAGPPGTDLDQLGRGLADASEAAGCVVVGGDLAGSPVLVVSVSVLGTLRGPAGVGPLLRAGARPGHRLVVTGPLGRSAAGLRLLRQSAEAEDDRPVRGRTASTDAGLIQAYRRPVARLAAGEKARLSGASAAIDISDGLGADLRHLARSSGVGIALDRVPVADGASESEALGGGEDYELIIATADPERVVEAFRSAGLADPIDIGRCTDRPGQYTWAGRPLPATGWKHRF